MMKYRFPITANMRKFLPSAEKALSEVEAIFKDITREEIGLVVTSQIMTLDVNTPIALTADQINLLKATALPLLVQQFPGKDIEIGEPTID